MVTFKHIERTGLTKTEILRRARSFRKAAQARGSGPVGLQEAVDLAIDAAIEYAQ